MSTRRPVPRRVVLRAIGLVLAVTTAARGGDPTGPASAAPVATQSGTPSGGSGVTAGLLEAPEPWTKDVSGLEPSDRSEAIIGALAGMGGWGNGNGLQIDFGIPVLVDDGSAPRQTITAPADGYCFDGSACDPVPLDMPLPEGGNIPLIFADDRLSAAKWADLGIEAQSFNSIGPENFEVVDLGPEIPLTYDCARNR